MFGFGFKNLFLFRYDFFFIKKVSLITLISLHFLILKPLSKTSFEQSCSRESEIKCVRFFFFETSKIIRIDESGNRGRARGGRIKRESV